jgi:ribose transport system substrate-binding protein
VNTFRGKAYSTNNEREGKVMKRSNLLLFVMLCIIALLIIGSGKKEETSPVTGEEQKEEMMAGAEEVDSWILDVRTGLEKYRGKIIFEGPQGQKPTWDTELVLTNAEVEKIKKGNYTAAIAWHGQQGEYTDALGGGIKDGLKHLGIKLVAEASADFDPAKQKTDVESMMALKPDIIITLPTDSVTSVATFRPVVDAGVKLVLISNQPNGYVHGKDFVGITTSMPYDQGRFMADAIAKATKTKKVGIIFFDADFWIVNFIDDVVRDTLTQSYPDIEIAAEQGFANPATDIENSAIAIIQRYPEVDALYVSFGALPAALACESANRDDIKVISQGLDKPYMQNMLSGGSIYAIITDSTYNIGVNAALLGGYGVLDKPAPEYSISPSATITKENLREMWKLAFRVVPFPKELEALME